ncbi:MAG: twin-arginine translocase TatA/TatE family subunit [Methanosarcinales archaeon]
MIGTTEILLIGAAILLLFGATKVPELARSLGKALGEFRKAQRESELELSKIKKTMIESDKDISGKTEK